MERITITRLSGALDNLNRAAKDTYKLVSDGDRRYALACKDGTILTDYMLKKEMYSTIYSLLRFCRNENRFVIRKDLSNED